MTLERDLPADMNGIVSTMLNLTGFFDSPNKLFRYADKLNISLLKINKLRASLKAPRFSIVNNA